MKKILICNQKMYLTKDEAINVKQGYDEINFSNVRLIICPSYLNLNVFEDYELGVQNCFYEDKGAYTGEVSPYDLYLRGIKYAIIGHSERRRYDTDDIVNLKVKACLKNSITPIICIGETKLEKEMMKTSEVLKRQIKKALENVEIDNSTEILLAYEPIYKINTKDSLKKEEIEDVFSYISKVINEIGLANNCKLLYGGSVNSNNISDIQSDIIDGYLVGSASVNALELEKIVKCIK